MRFADWVVTCQFLVPECGSDVSCCIVFFFSFAFLFLFVISHLCSLAFLVISFLYFMLCLLPNVCYAPRAARETGF